MALKMVYTKYQPPTISNEKVGQTGNEREKYERSDEQKETFHPEQLSGDGPTVIC